MKKTRGWLLLCVLCLCRVAEGADSSGTRSSEWREFRDNLASYEIGVRGLSQQALSSNAPPKVIAYLQACVEYAQSVLLTTASPGDGRDFLGATANALDIRRPYRNAVIDAELGSDTFAREEDRLFNAYVAPYTKAKYLGIVGARVALFNAKYFDPDDPADANFLEAWLNSRLPWTRYKPGGSDWPRTEGVSRLEVTLRAEPIVLLDSDPSVGALLAIGQVFNLFPAVDPDQPPYPAVTPTTASKWIKRAGIRLGIGLTADDETDWLAGAGLQVRAFTAWGVYDIDGEDWHVAVGLSEWEWLKGILPLPGD